MLKKSAPRHGFPVLALLAALLLASLPVQAQPSRRPAAGLPAVAASGENGLSRFWSFVANLWQPGLPTKEGTSIDPDGKRGPVTLVAPAGGGSDEGTSIDPNGRQ